MSSVKVCLQVIDWDLVKMVPDCIILHLHTLCMSVFTGDWWKLQEGCWLWNFVVFAGDSWRPEEGSWLYNSACTGTGLCLQVTGEDLKEGLLTAEFCVQVIAGDLSQLQTQHSQTLAKLDDYKRKHLELSHRLLKVNWWFIGTLKLNDVFLRCRVLQFPEEKTVRVVGKTCLWAHCLDSVNRSVNDGGCCSEYSGHTWHLPSN